MGVPDPSGWESELAGLQGWQWFVAMWGTVLIAVGAAGALNALARTPSPARMVAVWRRSLRCAAGVGAVIVGVVGVIGAGATFLQWARHDP